MFHRSIRLIVSIVTAALIAAGCGSAEIIDEVQEAPTTTTAAPVEATTSPSTTTAVAEPVGPTFSIDVDELGKALEAELTDWQQANGAPAVSLSVRFRDVEPINIALGVSDLVSGEAVTTDDYFRIGSITKPMTAAIVLQMIDEGLIELDAPVRQYLPGWLDGYEYADSITIRQLMDHTNGLIEYALDPGFYSETGTRLETPIEPEEIWTWLADQEPLFAPGEGYSYETGGFLTLGTIIEQVTGNTAAAEMRSRIFEPAGASDIYLTPQEFPPEPVVHGYGRELMYFAATALIGRSDELGLMVNDEPVADVYELPQEVLQSAGWTGGGNEARPEAVAAVMMAMFDGTILTPEQVATMTEPVPGETYGLGISTDDVGGEIVYSHGGGVPGFRSQAGYLPDHDVAYAVSSSLIPLPEGAGVGDLQARIVPILTAAFAAN